jgi:hypothetical protein
VDYLTKEDKGRLCHFLGHGFGIKVAASIEAMQQPSKPPKPPKPSEPKKGRRDEDVERRS